MFGEVAGRSRTSWITLVVLVAALGALASCDSDTADRVREAVPSRTATPTAEAPSEEPAEAPIASEPAEPEPTGEPQPTDAPEPTDEPEPTQDPEPAPTFTVTETAEAQPSEQVPVEEAPIVDDNAAADTDGEDEGISWYGWLLIALAGLGLTFWIVRRGRRQSQSPLAAEAVGQLTAVRAAVDEPLLQWRARQLAAPATERDLGSDSAQRWSQVESRLTRSVDTLLTLETAEGDSEAGVAARDLRQAVEQYRRSVEAVTAALVSGGAERETQARAALTADTALLDRQLTSLRSAADLPEV